MGLNITFFRTFLLLSFLTTSFSSYAQHTFSIVAVDPDTGEIGSAGATCIDAEDGAIVISDIVLGMGAIHTQSYWNPSNQANARTRMEAGDSPQEIIDWLVANDVGSNATIRQYNIVDLNSGTPRSAAFTGANCFEEFIHITGPNYAIAGNILLTEDVVVDMETAFLATSGTLADKLMAALQGAKRPGADSRCLDDGVSSASAFIRVAQPSDTNSDYGNLSLDINVWITSNIFEPIDALQDAYDLTLGIEEDVIENDIVVFPNPTLGQTVIKSTSIMFEAMEITDITGKIISSESFHNHPMNNIYLDTSDYVKGIYFITLYSENNRSTTKKLIVI